MNLLNENITVIRSKDCFYNEIGEFIVNKRSYLTIKGRITSKSLLNDTKLIGKDLSGMIHIVTRENLLKALDTYSLNEADIVIFNNSMYRVISASGKHQIANLQHYRYTAELLNNAKYLEDFITDNSNNIIYDNSGEIITI